MAPLPQELIVDILLRLQVKPLLRFKCVSKCLCALIDTPDFINSHLTRSSQNFNLRKLIFSDSSNFHVFDLNVDFEKEILLLQKPASFLWKPLRGYCNGLFLSCRNNNFGFSLWNPSTHQFGNIPDCPFEVPADVELYRIVGLGLGYDDSIYDYKAFCIVHVERKIELEVQVWIYGLKSNKWRRSPQNFPYLDYKMDDGCCCVRFPGIGYFTDGSLHWLCNNIWPKSEIVSFDVRTETFSLVPQPVCPIKSVRGVLTELHVLEGCLCISYFMQYQPFHTYFYMRKKDGVDQFTWTKLFSVTETEPILPSNCGIYWLGSMEVLGYSERGDKILLHLIRDGMVWYDLKRKSFRKFEIDKQDPKWKAPKLYLESLVSVGDGALSVDDGA